MTPLAESTCGAGSRAWLSTRSRMLSAQKIAGVCLCLLAALAAASDPAPDATMPIGAAKKLPEGAACTVRGIVTAVMPPHAPFVPYSESSVFLEAEDRSAAIRVYPLPETPPQVGEELIVSGFARGQSSLEQVSVVRTERAAVQIRPLGLNAEAIYLDGSGVDNRCMLVTVWGEVVGEAGPCDDGELRLHILDGTVRDSASVQSWFGWTIPAGAVEVVIPSSLAGQAGGVLPCGGDWVRVTGVVYPGVPKSGSLRGVYVRSLAEISTVSTAP